MLNRISYFISLLTLISCVSDIVEPPEPCLEVLTYDDGIRELVRNKCNFSGCHDGSSGVGNYNTYRGIKRVLDTDAFKQEVVLSQSMPKDGELTEEEFKILKCWSENGYPEN